MIINILLIGVFILLIGSLWYQLKKQEKSVKKDYSFETDFTDAAGNEYRIVKLGGTKLLLRWPDEISQWQKMSFDDRKDMIQQSEGKVKKGILEKVNINGAIGYIAVDKTIRSITKVLNSANESDR